MQQISSEQNKRDTFRLALAGWFLLAVALRLIALPGGKIWFDEIYTLKISAQPPADILYWIRFDCHPPLYYLMVHGFMQVLSWLGDPFTSIAWLRLSSVLPGILICAILAAWAWQAQGRRAGLTALALAAVSPGLLFYSQELRNYSLVMMFVAAAGFFLFRLLRQPTWTHAALYIVATLGFLYSHNLAVLILLGNAAWALACPMLFRVRPNARLRFFVYGAFATIFILYLPQLRLIYSQFYEQFQPLGYLLPEQRWYHLLMALFYTFPGGPVESEAWNTPYGLLIVYVSVCLTLLLIAVLWRDRRRLSTAPLTRQLLAYIGFMLAFFLGTTLIATLMGLGKFFGHRTAIIVLPFWILGVVLLIEIIPRRRFRKRARFLVLALMIPCGVLSLQFRNAYRNDFHFLVQQHANQSVIADPGAETYYLTDQVLAGWVENIGPGLQFAPLSRMLEQGQGGAILLLNPFMESVQTAREIFVDAYLRHWASVHELSPQPAERHYEIYRMPAQQAAAFNRELEKRWDAVQSGMIRRANMLVLLPYAREFNNTRGFHFPELTDDQLYRWTRGPRQTVGWQAPARPGRYLVRLSFWWPGPHPAPRMTIDYRFGDEPAWQSLTAVPGAVVIEEVIITERPFEPLTLDILSDFYIPAFWDPQSEDTRQLGLMFMNLEMLPAPARGR